MPNSSSSIQDSSFIDPKSFENTSTTLASSSRDSESTHIVAIDCQNGYLGCAAYDKETRKMTCYLDTEFQSTDIVAEFKAFFLQVRDDLTPSLVLISTRFPVQLESIINDRDELTEYEILPDYEEAISYPDFWIRHHDPNSSSSEINVFNESFFDNDNELGAKCISAILLYISTETEITLDHCVKSFHITALHNNLIISSDSIAALHIFENEVHPNLHYSKNKLNQGTTTCLFRVLDHTCYQLGTKLLKKWLFKPSTNINTIQSRLDLVEIFLNDTNESKVNSLRASLRKMKNVLRIIHDMEIYPIPLSDWKTLTLYLKEYNTFQEVIMEVEGIEKSPLFKEFKDTLPSPIIGKMLKLINDTISFEKSEIMSRVIIQEGVNNELDEAFRVYNNIEKTLSEVARRLSQQLPELSEPLNLIYFPQLGYMIVVSNTDKPTIDQHIEYLLLTHEESQIWRLEFSTESHHYYKSLETNSLDEEIGDIFGIICDFELEILQSLQEELYKYFSMIEKSCNLSAQIDCHISLAWAAKKYGYVKPILSNNLSVEIIDGFHPLYSQLVPTYIPNSTHLATTQENESQSNNIMLVTGANFSGKTVYLTQTALIVYMAHLGSFVPATSAKIGIVDRILTRISTRESMSKNKSSFLTDLEQVSSIFRLMTRRSLLIVDEFGKGTESKGSRSPKLLASTHFHELLEQNIIDSTKNIQVYNMEIHFSENESTKKLTYLYKLKPGKASSSFGICCARMCGVDENILKLAEKIYEQKIFIYYKAPTPFLPRHSSSTSFIFTMSNIALANSAYPALYLFSPFFDLYDTDQSINFQTADYISDFKPQGRYYKTYISSPDLVDQQKSATQKRVKLT